MKTKALSERLFWGSLPTLLYNTHVLREIHVNSLIFYSFTVQFDSDDNMEQDGDDKWLTEHYQTKCVSIDMSIAGPFFNIYSFKRVKDQINNSNLKKSQHEYSNNLNRTDGEGRAKQQKKCFQNIFWLI